VGQAARAGGPQSEWFGEFTPDAMLAGLTLTVSHDGTPVEGTIEVVDRPRLTGVLLWRPARNARRGCRTCGAGSSSSTAWPR
jgi:hypothetical protein